MVRCVSFVAASLALAMNSLTSAMKASESIGACGGVSAYA